MQRDHRQQIQRLRQQKALLDIKERKMKLSVDDFLILISVDVTFLV